MQSSVEKILMLCGYCISRRTSHTYTWIWKPEIIRTNILLWLWWGYDPPWGLTPSVLHRNKHTRTHTTHDPHTQAHTAPPKNCRGEKACPARHPSSTHEGYSHARWTPQYSTDGREDIGHRAGREMSQRQHNRQGEKKRSSFFRSKDRCRCQHSHAVKKKKKHTRRECDGREGVQRKKRNEDKLNGIKQTV